MSPRGEQPFQGGGIATTEEMVEGGGAGGLGTGEPQGKGESGAVWALWSVDPASGNGKLVERGDNDTISWEVDLAGRPPEEDEALEHILILYNNGIKSDKTIYKTTVSKISKSIK